MPAATASATRHASPIHRRRRSRRSVSIRVRCAAAAYHHRSGRCSCVWRVHGCAKAAIPSRLFRIPTASRRACVTCRTQWHVVSELAATIMPLPRAIVRAQEAAARSSMEQLRLSSADRSSDDPPQRDGQEQHAVTALLTAKCARQAVRCTLCWLGYGQGVCRVPRVPSRGGPPIASLIHGHRVRHAGRSALSEVTSQGIKVCVDPPCIGSTMKRETGPGVGSHLPRACRRRPLPPETGLRPLPGAAAVLQTAQGDQSAPVDLRPLTRYPLAGRHMASLAWLPASPPPCMIKRQCLCQWSRIGVRHEPCIQCDRARSSRSHPAPRVWRWCPCSAHNQKHAPLRAVGAHADHGHQRLMRSSPRNASRHPIQPGHRRVAAPWRGDQGTIRMHGVTVPGQHSLGGRR